jgi:hypothetical protein
MRIRALAASLLVAGIAAAAASANARPVFPGDRALLARPATPEERIAERVADRLTRHHVSVRCGDVHVSNPHVTGVTPMLDGRPFDYFLMRPPECAYLAWFRRDPARWDPLACVTTDCAYVSRIALALATVSHESYHLLGYSNEARVECYGMQSIWFVAHELGATVAESQAIASFYADRIYPLRRTNTPAYWSPECRDGGTLDLRPASHRWPS